MFTTISASLNALNLRYPFHTSREHIHKKNSTKTIHLSRSQRTSRIQTAQEDGRIAVNAGGTVYKILKSDIEKYPQTLLGSKNKTYFYDAGRRQYFFDRDPDLFRHVSSFYRTGRIQCREDECLEAVLEELNYFRIPSRAMCECCKDEYLCALEKRKVRLERQQDKMDDIALQAQKVSSLFSVRKSLWLLLNYPETCFSGLLFSRLLAVVVILNIILMCIESIPCAPSMRCVEMYPSDFLNLDATCVSLLSLDYLLKLFSAPDRRVFIRRFDSIIDCLSLLPSFIQIAVFVITDSYEIQDSTLLVLVQGVRSLRVLRLSRFSRKFKNLTKALSDASSELGFIVFAVLIIDVLFATIVFFVEKDVPGTNFNTIPAAMWYVLVTLTSLGYGDVVPITALGKVFGAIVSLHGIIILNLPVPIIETKLSAYQAGMQ